MKNSTEILKIKAFILIYIYNLNQNKYEITRGNNCKSQSQLKLERNELDRIKEGELAVDVIDQVEKDRRV
jgi:hypothetical protein